MNIRVSGFTAVAAAAAATTAAMGRGVTIFLHFADIKQPCVCTFVLHSSCATLGATNARGTPSSSGSRQRQQCRKKIYRDFLRNRNFEALSPFDNRTETLSRSNAIRLGELSSAAYRSKCSTIPPLRALFSRFSTFVSLFSPEAAPAVGAIEYRDRTVLFGGS